MNSRIYYCLTVIALLFTTAGCSDSMAPSSEVSVAPATHVVFNATGAPTVEFSVPDMMCPEGCAVEVKEILAKQPGAKDVLVDFEAKTATVAIEQDEFDAAQALAALIDKQFTNSALKDDAVNPQAAEGEAIQ
jgi:copper chaperone CopZ